jgi:hypothetical protein
MRIPIYDYFFYELFCFAKKTPSKDDAEWTTIISISLLQGFNIDVLLKGNFEIFSNIRKNVFFSDYKIMFIFLLIINYFVFIYNGRYKNIVNYYQMENDENFIYGKSIILIYVILSILLLFF